MARSVWISIGTTTLFITTSLAGWFPAQQFPTGDIPYAVAEGDFNQDGHSDLATANAKSDDVTVLLAHGDGHVDLLTAGDYGTVTFLPGLGDGTFGDGLPYAASSSLTALVVSDFDRDGWADIAAGGGTPGVAIMFNQGPASPRVEIDIKPGDTPNSINPHSRGVIPVAILGSAAFDVQDLDATTLRFGPNAAPIAHKKAHSEDVNDDGIMDLVTHFRTQETGVACDDESVTLAGEIFDGHAIEASDTIQTVGCRNSRWPGASFDQGRRHE